MIQFCCEHCGHKLSVSDGHTDKRGKCPKCKKILIVPKVEAAISAPQINHSADSKADLVGDGTLTLMDVPEECKLKDKPFNKAKNLEQAIEKEPESEQTEEIDSYGEYTLPWFIDIFLFI